MSASLLKSSSIYRTAFRGLCRTGSRLQSEQDLVVNVKDTVFLPQSSFPISIKSTERSRLDAELASKASFASLYEWQQSKNAPDFRLLDGPPYANGAPHVGHAVNKIAKDFVVRTRVALGFKVHYQPGWDCHGLPIELAVRKSNKETDPDVIRSMAATYAQSFIDYQGSIFKRWAVTADWKHSYSTMDPKYIAAELRILGDIFEKGFVYRAFKPVHWSPSSETALAESELEYNDKHVSQAVFFKFPIINLPLENLGITSWKRRDIPRLFALIWTTTPWTLPVNNAIAYNKTFNYSVIQFEDNKKEPIEEFFIVAEKRLGHINETLKRTFEVKSTFTGNLLNDRFYRSVMHNEHALPFLSADHVNVEIGTGLVHSSFAHGFDDYKLGSAIGEEICCFVDEKGRFHRNLGIDLEGKNVLTDGQNEVLKKFQKHVVHQEKYTHSYPYDWRTHQPVIIRSTRQWFINVGEVGNRCAQKLSNEEVKIGSGQKDLSSTMAGFLTSRPDWCISRQRCWGVPIPALIDSSTDKAYTSKILIDAVATETVKDLNAYWKMTAKELIKLGKVNDRNFEPDFVQLEQVLRSENAGESNLSKSADIVDVWLDSGMAWHLLAGEKADVVLEGIDQYRGWFSSLLLTSMMARVRRMLNWRTFQDEVPYKRVLVHGFTVDEKQKKMSKSLGNVVDPNSITDGSLRSEALGADGLRLWAALYGCEHSGNIKIGPNVLSEVKESIRRVRLLLRFVLGSVKGFTGQQPDEFNLLDQFIIKETLNLSDRVKIMWTDHEYRFAVNSVLQFLQNPFSSTYVHLVRDRLYCNQVGSNAHLSAQYTLDVVGRTLVQLLAPFLPHLSAEFCSHHHHLQGNLAESYRTILTSRQIPDDIYFHEKLDYLLKTTSQLRGELSYENTGKLATVVTVPPPDYKLFQSIHSTQESTSSELVELLGVSSVRLEEGTEFGIKEISSSMAVCKRCRKTRKPKDADFCPRCSHVIQMFC